MRVLRILYSGVDGFISIAIDPSELEEAFGNIQEAMILNNKEPQPNTFIIATAINGQPIIININNILAATIADIKLDGEDINGRNPQDIND